MTTKTSTLQLEKPPLMLEELHPNTTTWDEGRQYCKHNNITIYPSMGTVKLDLVEFLTHCQTNNTEYWFVIPRGREDAIKYILAIRVALFRMKRELRAMNRIPQEFRLCGLCVTENPERRIVNHILNPNQKIYKHETLIGFLRIGRPDKTARKAIHDIVIHSVMHSIAVDEDEHKDETPTSSPPVRLTT